MKTLGDLEASDLTAEDDVLRQNTTYPLANGGPAGGELAGKIVEKLKDASIITLSGHVGTGKTYAAVAAARQWAAEPNAQAFYCSSEQHDWAEEVRTKLTAVHNLRERALLVIDEAHRDWTQAHAAVAAFVRQADDPDRLLIVGWSVPPLGNNLQEAGLQRVSIEAALNSELISDALTTAECPQNGYDGQALEKIAEKFAGQCVSLRLLIFLWCRKLLSPKTKVYGVVGDTINEVFREVFDSPQDNEQQNELREVLGAAAVAKLVGVSVTPQGGGYQVTQQLHDLTQFCLLQEYQNGQYGCSDDLASALIEDQYPKQADCLRLLLALKSSWQVLVTLCSEEDLRAKLPLAVRRAMVQERAGAHDAGTGSGSSDGIQQPDELAKNLGPTTTGRIAYELHRAGCHQGLARSLASSVLKQWKEDGESNRTLEGWLELASVLGGGAVAGLTNHVRDHKEACVEELKTCELTLWYVLHDAVVLLRQDGAEGLTALLRCSDVVDAVAELSDRDHRGRILHIVEELGDAEVLTTYLDRLVPVFASDLQQEGRFSDQGFWRRLGALHSRYPGHDVGPRVLAKLVESEQGTQRLVKAFLAAPAVARWRLGPLLDRTDGKEDPSLATRLAQALGQALVSSGSDAADGWRGLDDLSAGMWILRVSGVEDHAGVLCEAAKRLVMQHWKPRSLIYLDWETLAWTKKDLWATRGDGKKLRRVLIDTLKDSVLGQEPNVPVTHRLLCLRVLDRKEARATLEKVLGSGWLRQELAQVTDEADRSRWTSTAFWLTWQAMSMNVKMPQEVGSLVDAGVRSRVPWSWSALGLAILHDLPWSSSCTHHVDPRRIPVRSAAHVACALRAARLVLEGERCDGEGNWEDWATETATMVLEELATWEHLKGDWGLNPPEARRLALRMIHQDLVALHADDALAAKVEAVACQMASPRGDFCWKEVVVERVSGVLEILGPNAAACLARRRYREWRRMWVHLNSQTRNGLIAVLRDTRLWSDVRMDDMVDNVSFWWQVDAAQRRPIQRWSRLAYGLWWHDLPVGSVGWLELTSLDRIAGLHAHALDVGLEERSILRLRSLDALEVTVGGVPMRDAIGERFGQDRLQRIEDLERRLDQVEAGRARMSGRERRDDELVQGTEASLRSLVSQLEEVSFPIARWLRESELGVRFPSMPVEPLLGEYYYARRGIVLYPLMIELAARQVAAFAGLEGDACNTALTTLVEMHESAHAVLHLGRDPDGNYWRSLTTVHPDLHECLAQFLVARLVEELQDPILCGTFVALHGHLPTPYRAWEALVDCDAEDVRRFVVDIRRGRSRQTASQAASACLNTLSRGARHGDQKLARRLNYLYERLEQVGTSKELADVATALLDEVSALAGTADTPCQSGFLEVMEICGRRSSGYEYDGAVLRSVHLQEAMRERPLTEEEESRRQELREAIRTFVEARGSESSESPAGLPDDEVR